MFASRIRILTQNLLQKFQSIRSRSQLPLPQKLTLVATSLFLLPHYIKLASQNQQQQLQPISISKLAAKQEVEDQIINYIQQYDDAKKLNLSGHTLIWYQCSGIQGIDEEVKKMLGKFVKEKAYDISCPFKVIIDTTPRSKEVDKSDYYKKPVELVILKSDTIKPIPLSKHLSYSGTSDLKYSHLFQRLINQINEVTEISINNIKQFSESFGDRSTQGFIIMNAPKDLVKYRKAKKIFSSFLDDKQLFTANTNKVIVTDQFAMRYLGLPDYVPGNNNIYVLVPDSENVVKEGKVVRINGLKYHIFNPWSIKESVVFMPYLQKSTPDSLSLKITVDLNQNISEQLSTVYEALKKSQKYPNLSEIPKLLTFGSAVGKDRAIEVSLEKNNFDKIVNVYSPDCRYSDEEKRKLIYSGNKWNFADTQISAESLEKWISDVLEHKVEPTFDSEKKEVSKVKRYNSTRITGEQYAEALNKNKDKPKIVFHYSEHCFSCNKFKHIYEQIAEQKKQQYDFYRIDNDFNRSPGLINFNSTPIFAIYRGNKYFLYKNTIFTKSLFEDFLKITKDIKLIDADLVDNAVEDRNRNTIDLKEFL